MALEEFLVKDFQNVDRFEVELDPHVTCFVGDSFAGKSARLRALKWVLTNQPAGDWMVGRWGKARYAFTKVWLDGRTVARSRGPGEGINEYRLDGGILKAFGPGKVPGPVADLVNVSAVNFQDQHDAPYWFTLPAAEVSRSLNTIINLGEIDAALAEAAARVRKAKLSVDVSEERLRKAETEAAETAWAVAFNDRLIHAESQFAAVEQLEQRHSALAELAGLVTRAAGEQKAAAAVSVALANGIAAVDRVRRLQAERADLLVLLDKIADARRAITPLPDLTKLQQARLAVQQSERDRHALAALIFGLENSKWELKDSQQRVTSITSKLGTSRCPACGQLLDQSRDTPSPSSPPTGTSDTRSRGRAAKTERVGIEYNRTPSNR